MKSNQYQLKTEWKRVEKKTKKEENLNHVMVLNKTSSSPTVPDTFNNRMGMDISLFQPENSTTTVFVSDNQTAEL